MTNFNMWLIYNQYGDIMLQVEIIEDKNEEQFVYKVNYFLSKIDECLVKEIKYSSFLLPETKEIYFTVLIIYLIMWFLF